MPNRGLFGFPDGKGIQGATGATGAIGPMGATGPTGAAGGVGGFLLIQDRKTSNTAGGTFTNAAWRTRVLNTMVVDSGIGASLASNQITLPAGTYRVFARSPAWAVDNHQCRLQNITDATTVEIGSSGDSRASNPSTTDSTLQARFTIAGSKVFELQAICNTSSTINGFGVPGGFGVQEVYSSIEFLKE